MGSHAFPHQMESTSTTLVYSPDTALPIQVKKFIGFRVHGVLDGGSPDMEGFSANQVITRRIHHLLTLFVKQESPAQFTRLSTEKSKEQTITVMLMKKRSHRS